MRKHELDLNRLLLLIAAALAAVIVLTTLIALIAGKRPGMNLRKNDPSTIEEIKGASQNLKAFKEFGTLRISTQPEENTEGTVTVMVITPWFSYENDDSAFYEELVARKGFFTSRFAEYFSSRTKNALLSIGEKQIKAQLLEQFNSELIMGNLTAIYFDDYMFLD